MSMFVWFGLILCLARLCQWNIWTGICINRAVKPDRGIKHTDCASGFPVACENWWEAVIVANSKTTRSQICADWHDLLSFEPLLFMVLIMVMGTNGVFDVTDTKATVLGIACSLFGTAAGVWFSFCLASPYLYTNQSVTSTGFPKY